MRIALLPLVALLVLASARSEAGSPASEVTVSVDLTPAGAIKTFRPDEALGAGIDGAQKGDIDRLFTAHNIAAMRSAGLIPLTYRLRTELGIEAWHWNPEGAWSDPEHSQGYWTSSDRPGRPVLLSWGYLLPRRGDTVDNANNTGYSRLTDGDAATFWKSNPYLEAPYVVDGRAHPQWLVVRLDAPAPVDAADILWAEPYARAYEVQYWTGRDEYDPQGLWAAFPGGRVQDGRGGEARLTLAQHPIETQFIRIRMTEGSHTAPAGADDPRDRLGYAVREVSFGRKQADGRLEDWVKHAPSHDGQTFAHVSSTDPWHRAVDRDEDLEQVGVDRIFASGLGGGRPIMFPAAVLYDTPDNAAALVRYMKRRGYPVRQIEIGEEPDGQYGEAADYGALYLALVDRLRPENTDLVFGGPSLQSAFTDTWMDPDPDHSWNSRFVRYLKARDRLADLGFFSFEHYPFDDICGDLHARLLEQSRLMDQLLARAAAEGVPRTIPWVISEYGFSAYSGRAMSEPPSALLMANIVGQFLSGGGDAAYLFGYGPNVPVNQHQPCAGYGNMMLHLADPSGQAGARTPAYYTARMITRDWLTPGHGLHGLRATRASGGGEDVKAFAATRPDGRLGVLVINRSPTSAAAVRLRTLGGGEQRPGRADLWLYGPAQYHWRDAGEASRPDLDLPPEHRSIAAGDVFVTPPDSLAVLVASGIRPTRP